MSATDFDDENDLSLPPIEAAAAMLDGPARWRVRWLAGDLIVAAVKLGRAARARRPGARRTGARRLPETLATLGRAVAWASLLRLRLRRADRTAEAPRIAALRPVAPSAALPGTAAGSPCAPQGSSAPAPRPIKLRLVTNPAADATTGGATDWAALARRARLGQAQEARRALARQLAAQPLAEALAQIEDELTAAARRLHEPALEAELRATLRALAAAFGPG